MEKWHFNAAKFHNIRDITLNSKFRYYNANFAYKNWDKLIYHVNRRHGDKVNVMYSTPACYTKARHESNFTWTVKTDDFMPYTDAPGGKYESGYFTSRPGISWKLLRFLQEFPKRKLKILMKNRTFGWKTNIL